VISGAADEDERRELQDFLTCVSDRVNAAPKASQSGLGVSATLEGMVRDCAAALGATLHGAVMSDGGAVLEIGRPDGSRPGFVCAQRGVDPRLAGRVYTVLEIAQRAEERARVARDRAAAYDDKAKAASDAGNKHQAAGYKALKALNEELSEFMEQQAKELRNLGKPDGGTPPLTTSLTAPGDDITPCAAAADLAAKIGECVRRLWIGGGCEMLAAQLHWCSDPRITDPTPDAPTCAEQRAAAEENADAVLEAYLAGCESVVRYGPDGGSPCVASSDSDTPSYDIHKAHPQVCPSPSGGEVVCVTIDVCSNEKAMPTEDPETCFGTATVLSTVRTLADVLAEAYERLGGPLWTPPTGGTGPSNPQPGPKH
jgi:hypothetical protein